MPRLFRPLFLLSTFASVLASSYDNNVYLIRHGEKPPNGGNGLSLEGLVRAECLSSILGPDSTYNIGYILAQKPKKNGKRKRPFETVVPLAKELGLTVDTSCDRDDIDCVTRAVEKFSKTNSTNILICWEHDALRKILKSLGVKKAPKYPGKAFDLIWTVHHGKLVSQASENCPGLDDHAQEPILDLTNKVAAVQQAIALRIQA